jgi:uncharacterized SAM-binding protein YcdF (DUF218 family)
MNKNSDTTRERRPFRKLLSRFAVLTSIVLLVIASLMRWGGYLLESTDPVPTRADGAIVLEGSIAGERARLAGAMQLLRQGVPERVLLTVPPTSYWGDPVPPMARRFLERNYGQDLAERVDFCDVGPDVDSTVQEAQALNRCILEHQWKSVVVVTSNYHTRRAGLIWRRVMGRLNPSLRISVYGVDDPEFQADDWWRRRLWAKTWVLEFTKLIWAETARS